MNYAVMSNRTFIAKKPVKIYSTMTPELKEMYDYIESHKFVVEDAGNGMYKIVAVEPEYDE